MWLGAMVSLPVFTCVFRMSILKFKYIDETPKYYLIENMKIRATQILSKIYHQE